MAIWQDAKTTRKLHVGERFVMSGLNISVGNLPMALQVDYKAWGYDFNVYMTDGEYGWRGLCRKRDLQVCIELGRAAYAKLLQKLRRTQND